MTQNLSDTLDLVLERLRTGEPISAILADYPAEAEQLGPLLETAATLDNIPPVVMPTPVDLQADRADFLVQVTNLQQQAVFPGFFGRLKEGIVHKLPWLTLAVAHSEGRQRRMSTLAIKVMLVFGLLFGSAGATAAMAANSLPDSPLYPVKLAMEDARLAATSNPAQQAVLHLAMARERTQEMAQQALKGEVPGEATLSRLQRHLNYALQLAGQLPDEEMAGVLTQAREMSQIQAQQLTQTQAQVREPAQEPLGYANQLLNQVRREAEGGLEDPVAFRNRFGQNRPGETPLQLEQPVEKPVPPEEPTPLEGTGPDPVLDPNLKPDCPTGDCSQNQHQYGQESDTLSGHYGELCDASGECEPAGDENQYGQQEPDPVSEPGQYGNRCQSSGEGCEETPFGEQNQYGQDTGQTEAPPEDAGCGVDCSQNQNQEQQPTGPTGNDDNGQNGPLIGPGGSPASGDDGGTSGGGSNSGGDNGGSDNSNGSDAKNGGGGKKN